MKLFGFALIMLLAGNEAYAGISEDALRYTVKCIGGQKFLTTWTAHNGHSSATTIQVYEKSNVTGGAAQPVSCNDEDYLPAWKKK